MIGRCRVPGELVVPAVDDQLSIRGIADRLLPLVPALEESTLDDAAAGKAEEAGMKILEELDEIGAQAVLSMRPRVGWEDRHHVEVDRARASGHDAGERVKLGRFSRDGSGELLPGRGQPLERDAAEGAALRVFELDAYRGWPVRAAVRQKADGVAFAVPDADAAEALVADAELPRRRCHAEVVRVRGARGRRGLDRETSGRVGERRAAPAHQRIGKLERAVLHSLGVNPAVGGEVDVLEEDAE